MKKTYDDMQENVYKLIYFSLGSLNEVELKSVVEHINSPYFKVSPSKKKQIALSFLWKILNAYNLGKLQLLALKQIVFK